MQHPPFSIAVPHSNFFLTLNPERFINADLDYANEMGTSPEPGGLKKITGRHYFFCCSMDKDGNSNLEFESLTHGRQSSPPYLPKMIKKHLSLETGDLKNQPIAAHFSDSVSGIYKSPIFIQTSQDASGCFSISSTTMPSSMEKQNRRTGCPSGSRISRQGEKGVHPSLLKR